MAIKLADTLTPMADFPAAMAEHVEFADGENLQEKLDNGSLGSSEFVEVDIVLDETSENPIANKIVAEKFSEINEKVFSTHEFIERKVNIFSCDYSNSNGEPLIQYNECYLNRKNGTLNFDITITFENAEIFIDRTLTILDSDCYCDIDNYDTSIHSCSMYLFDISETSSQGGIDKNKCSNNALGFNGNGATSSIVRIVACLPIASGTITPSIQDNLNKCINNAEITTDGLKVTNVLEEETIAVPLASKDRLGLVTTSSTQVSVTRYHQPCPIVGGVPYYEKHVYEGMLYLNGTNNVGSYKSDTTNDKVTISIPCGNDIPHKRVFNIYLYHMDNLANTGAPNGYIHLTLFPKILAYPSTTFLAYIIKTDTTSGGAILENSKFNVSGHNAEQQYLDFTITGVSGWQNNLFYKVVVD